jgi:sigma-E factor negative regulatory protein RseA
MTANQNELLSALVDGELNGNELQQALELLNSSEQARKQFQHYQLASDVMHGHVPLDLKVDLTGPITDALLDEPVMVPTTKHKAKVIPFPKQFWRQATGLALAASVGALAVIGVMTQPQNQLMPATSLATIGVMTQPQNQLMPATFLAANEVAATAITVAQTGNRWTVEEEDVEQLLNTYLVDHNEYSGASGVFSYARVVTYDAGQ